MQQRYHHWDQHRRAESFSPEFGEEPPVTLNSVFVGGTGAPAQTRSPGSRWVDPSSLDISGPEADAVLHALGLHQQMPAYARILHSLGLHAAGDIASSTVGTLVAGGIPLQHAEQIVHASTRMARKAPSPSGAGRPPPAGGQGWGRSLPPQLDPRGGVLLSETVPPRADHRPSARLASPTRPSP
eukprot:Hpha_TRINITY_DN16520_c2_g1::TRINITY_DN16520_c2_g1_i1::g.132826::m.132826